MGVSRVLVGHILNHAERGVTAVYDRYSYDAEKRAALNLWARAPLGRGKLMAGLASDPDGYYSPAPLPIRGSDGNSQDDFADPCGGGLS